MIKNGIGSKTVYSNTKEGITTFIEIRYNPRTNHIMFGATRFQKSHGWNNASVTNKQSSQFLGVTVAEQVLFNVFNHVERMSYTNQGFDFICNNGYMIEVKSSTKRKNKKYWMFNIKRNQIADYFLCIAFDDRKNLNPLHIWLIPSKVINYLTGLVISESKLDSWSKFELSDKLDKVIGCCNIMKGVKA